MIPQALINEAFVLMLGRMPRQDSPMQIETYQDLLRIIVGSPEFKKHPRARKRGCAWPKAQFFVSQRARVVYNPIGKNACTFLKQQIARMSGLPSQGFLLRDIHALTDRLNLGLQFGDFTEAETVDFLNRPDYMRIALLRDPGERLLSAYIEKFVLGRMDPGNINHSRTIVDPVQKALGMETPDYNHGITFRQFITAVCTMQVPKLDPHWIQQSAYLAGVTWDRLFAFEDIGDMVDLLEERSGMTLPRQETNVSGSGKGTFIAGAADMLPAALQGGPRANFASFFDEEIIRMVEEGFAEDFKLIARAREQKQAQATPAGI